MSQVKSSLSTSYQSHEHLASVEAAVDYRPKIESKKVLISRASLPATRTSRSSFYGSSSGSHGGGFLSFNPAIYSKMAGAGVADFKGIREKEKVQMQDCNDRLATYIEKVRWLEAKNKQLEAELEALRNQKQEDWKPIRDMYEGELDQARLVISQLSAQKGVGESRLAGLQDEIAALKAGITTYELNTRDYISKIDSLNGQLGEFEGEVATLRMRCGSLEDDLAKQRNLVSRSKEEIDRLRTDLDVETTAHIEFEVMAQTKSEECDFFREALDKLQIVQQAPAKVKGVDMEAFFKGELRQAITGIREMYEDKMVQFSEEMEKKYAMQMDHLRSGTMRDTMEVEHYKADVKRLKDVLNERQTRIAELETALASMRAERDNFAAQMAEVHIEMESIRTDLTRKLNDSQIQIELLMTTIQELIDAKLSLQLEIASYTKLLEGEEDRMGLRQLVQQTIGSQSITHATVGKIVEKTTTSSSHSSGGHFIGQSGSSSSHSSGLTVSEQSGSSSSHSGGSHVIRQSSSSSSHTSGGKVIEESSSSYSHSSGGKVIEESSSSSSHTSGGNVIEESSSGYSHSSGGKFIGHGSGVKITEESSGSSSHSSGGKVTVQSSSSKSVSHSDGISGGKQVVALEILDSDSVSQSSGVSGVSKMSAESSSSSSSSQSVSHSQSSGFSEGSVVTAHEVLDSHSTSESDGVTTTTVTRVVEEVRSQSSSTPGGVEVIKRTSKSSHSNGKNGGVTQVFSESSTSSHSTGNGGAVTRVVSESSTSSHSVESSSKKSKKASKGAMQAIQQSSSFSKSSTSSSK